MDVFKLQGRPLAYVRQGQGTPIVFLHNGGTSHVIWQAQLAALAARHEVWALDLPGYGRSAPPAAYTLSAYTDLLSAFVQAQVGEVPVTLVGNCMGSAIALHLAQRQSARVRALVLINPLTAATFAAGGLGTLSALRQRQPRLAALLADGVRRSAIPAWAITPLIKLQLGPRGRALRVWANPALRACYHPLAPLPALTGLFQALPEYAALDALKPASGLPPIYTLWGQRNRILSAEAGAVLNATLRPVQARLLADCGHLPMLERPDAVTELIRAAASG